MTDHARTMGLPLDPARLRTEKEGQVLGLGKGKVQQVLARHGIDRVLAEEGGRTSRGSMGKMNAYVALLNELHAEADSALDLDQVEAFWISRVQLFFAGKPLVMRLDPQASLRTAFRNLFEQAEVRQRETPGTMVVGTVLQHLVGAKLEGAYGEVEHHSASTKDEGQSRPGDFSIGDLAIHVSTAPGEALIRKCQTNLSGGQRPVILTLGRGVALATGLGENAGIADRIDVFDAHQWLAASALDQGGDSPQARAHEIGQLLEIYNRIVETTETDPSLKIILATGRV
ncbi:DUF4928 family protein [Brevundimonas sp.]|uniref:DUF4928 family protein n=1 Tax=Brevundimonas sp. TaxID=1871086 RepID=UPI0025BFA8A8|nr:DUF4928 family protein [Brevundimonas sp.]